MLPQLNQAAQGNNVQLPQVPGAQQSQANMASQATPAMGARPFSGMAPDNGQHGGAPRYQTPTSGAMNRSMASAMPNPYPSGTQGPRPPSGGSRPAMFDPQRVVQTAQHMQNAMPFNRALQERFLSGQGQRQAPQPQAPQQQAPQQQASQQPLPPMFNR